MSVYYDFFLAEKIDGEFRFIGPFNREGKLVAALSVSGSFMSVELKDRFYYVDKDKLGEELEKFEGESYKVAALRDLPKGDFIRSGYFRVEDVRVYEEAIARGEDGRWLDIFYDRMTPIAYAQMALTDAENAKRYMWFAYPEYDGEEFLAHQIRIFASAVLGWEDKELYVVLRVS